MSELLKQYRIPLLFICGALMLSCANIQRVAIPGAVFNELQMKWNLTASQVTGFGASFMYVYAFAQLLVGLLCDRYGGARIIAVGGLVFLTGSFLFALLDNYIWLCVSRGLTGLGACTFFLGLVTEVFRYCKKNSSLVLSFIIMTGYAGGVIANAPFSFAVCRTSLTFVLLAVSLLPLAIYLCYLLPFFSIPRPAVKNIPFSGRSLLNVMKRKSNWNIYLFFSVHWGLFYSIQTVIGKKFLEDFCHVDTGLASLFLSLTSLLTALSGLLYVMLCRHLGNRRKPLCLTTAFTTMSFFLILVVMTALDIRCILPALLFCLFALVSSLSAIVVPMVKENNDPGETSIAVAFLNSFSYIMVAVCGNLIGGILNQFAPENAGGKLIYSRNAYLTVFGVVLLCACGVVYWAWHIKEKK